MIASTVVSIDAVHVGSDLILMVQQIRRKLVEAHYVEQHPPEPGRDEVPPLCKDGLQRGPRPLEPAIVTGYSIGSIKDHRWDF